MARSELILVYDVGTTGLKCAAFDASGGEVDATVAPYRTYYPRPGWAEQDPEDYRAAAIAATRALEARGAVDLGSVAVIGLSGHMNGCLPVDSSGAPLGRELIHSDSRSWRERESVLEIIDQDEFIERTGNRVDEHLSLPKILWIRRQEPERYRDAAFFLNAKDYLRSTLTGVLGETDYSDASLTCGMDIRARRWDRELLRELGLDPLKFPLLRGSAEVTGSLSATAAAALGLKAGTPVVTGGGDAACATRGAGIRDAAAAYACVGSSAWISTLLPRPAPDPRMQNFFDLDGVRCNLCGTVQSAGIAVDWALGLVSGLRKEGGAQKKVDFAAVEEAVGAVPAGADGVLFVPYLMGERTPYWDADARGAFIGFSLYHDRNTLLRSVYEGVAFALRDVLEVYRDLGLGVAELTLLGGGAASPLWRGIMRDTWNLPLRPHAAPLSATSLGAAMAAGVGVGMFRDLDEATELVRREEPIAASAPRAAVYGELYGIYREVYGTIKPIYEKLAAARPREENHRNEEAPDESGDNRKTGNPGR